MYFANDSVAGVFEAKPQENKKPVPSIDKEATAHTDKEVVSNTGKEASPSAVRVAVTHSDNKEQVCGLIERYKSIMHCAGAESLKWLFHTQLV